MSLGQRLTFESNDPLVALTFVAAVTTRIRLLTSVLCLPYHKVGVTAQQAATLDRLSEGRFSFGLGLGGRRATSPSLRRPGPIVASGSRTSSSPCGASSGRRAPIRRRRTSVGPTPYTPGGPELIVGAFAPAGLERAGRLADGIRSFSFSTDPEEHVGRYQIMLRAWEKAGREGKPRLIAATHFSLGPNARQSYEAHVAKYYGYSRATVDQALSEARPPRRRRSGRQSIALPRPASTNWSSPPPRRIPSPSPSTAWPT